MLEVRLLGTFDVKAGRKPVSLNSRPAQSLFAFLALNAGTAFRREKLAGQIWPEATEVQARDYLRHALWRVRKALQAASAAKHLLADDLTISFDNTPSFWLDAAALREVSEAAPVDELIAVLSAYNGELLPGFYDEWVVLERENLQAAYERKVVCLLERLQETRRWADILNWAEKWIALGQKPEAAYRYLMSAHAAHGDMAKVAAAYERCTRALAEFGVQPSDQTRALYEALRAGKGAVAIPPTPQPIAARTIPLSNIPVPLTRFVRRDREVTEVSRLLHSQRLLTLVGSGGVGKTRLAIECATRNAARYIDGVFWIELAGLSEGSLIPHEIAKVLDLREIRGNAVAEAVMDRLRSMQALLVLDNCEHLIDACAQTAQELLGACPGVRILATSRERLGLFHETAWHVPSLSERASLELFRERAILVQPDFPVDEATRELTLQICRRLDGMPLAIELAAARLRVLSLGEIAARLDDRFALLTAGSRGALARHQTLRATIDWSYDLLAPAEKRLMERLGVFAGGFSLDAAEEICSDEVVPRAAILDALGRLVDKSLVVAERLGDVPTRYRLLETIRQYANEKLEASGGAQAARDRHLQFYTQLAGQAEPQLYRGEQFIWFERLESETDNLRAAMQWSAAGSPPDPRRQAQGLRLAGALSLFWERNHRLEVIQRVEYLLSKADASNAGRAWGCMVLGFLYWASTEHHNARAYLEQAVDTAARDGNQYVHGLSNGYLGAALVALGQLELAESHLQSAKQAGVRLGASGRAIVVWANGFLGDIPFARGNNEAARPLYEEALIQAEGLGDLNAVSYPSRRLGYLAIRQGRLADARRYIVKSLEANQKIRHVQGINRCVAALAGLRLAEGRLPEAVQLCAAVEAFMQKTSASFFHWDESFFNEVLDKLRESLSPATFKRAWERGAAMTLEDAVAFATSNP